MFTAKAMRVFIVLYQEQNMKAAAHKLCLTIPPVRRMLKLMEEWFGEPLFIRHSGRLVPTQKSKELYFEIFPYYQQIKDINKKSTNNNHYVISSPAINSYVISSVLEKFIKYCSLEIMDIKYSANININDNLHIAFAPIKPPLSFIECNTILKLELQCATAIKQDWRKKCVVCDHYLESQPFFQNAMYCLKSKGHCGKYRIIDNNAIMMEIVNNGDGIFWGKQNNHHLLNFTLLQPLYFYIKQTSTSEQLINTISHINKM